MADNTDFKQTAVLIAIDIAKLNHDVLFRFPDERTKTLRNPNHVEGYQFLLAAVAQYVGKVPVTAAFEPTADYHRTLAFWMHEQGIQCHLASSLACARAREMLYKTWDKHDRKDARVILYLLEQGMTLPFHDPLVQGHMDIQYLSSSGEGAESVLAQFIKSLFDALFS